MVESGIISRAKAWVDDGISYDQNKTHEGYRMDCSGYVSMAWQLSKPGATTSNLSSYCTATTEQALKQGDILLYPGSHVLIFDCWSTQTAVKDGKSLKFYWAYEETSTKKFKGARKNLTEYPYWGETGKKNQNYKPYTKK